VLARLQRLDKCPTNNPVTAIYERPTAGVVGSSQEFLFSIRGTILF
jgi:hypothetical protein